MFYHPELGEKAEARVFHMEHNFRNSYNLVWKVEDDECARAVLKKLRIRPAFGTKFEVKESGNLWNARLGGTIVDCLITDVAYDKLRDVDVAAIQLLLD